MQNFHMDSTIVLEVFAETSLFVGGANLSHNRDDRSSVFKVPFGRPAGSSTRPYFRERRLWKASIQRLG
jgi:hypothetical protein